MLPRTTLPGSAKALGLVRDPDSGSTATVARSEAKPSHHSHHAHDEPQDEDELAETSRRSEPRAKVAPEEDDELETVHRGHKRVAVDLAKPLDSFSVDVDADADTATPIGVKKVTTGPQTPHLGGRDAPQTPLEMVVPGASLAPISGPPPPPDGPVNAPESGCTRVAPIAPPTTAHVHNQAQAMAMMQAQAAQAQRSAPTGPMHHLLQVKGKALALPPHRIALLVSSILLFSAVLFLVLRKSPTAHVEVATNAFPPAPIIVPVEVTPPVLPVPVNGLIAPPGTPAPIVPAPSAHPQSPHPDRAASSPRRPPRPRVNIPVHREQ